MKFKFKYDSIKRIKEVFEKKAQKELMLLQLEIIKKEAEYESVLKRRMEENKKYVKISFAHDLKFHKNYIASLNDELEKIRSCIGRLLDEKELKLKELLQKSKEQEIFNTLEGIHYENYKDEQNKLETKSLDEISITRFNARGKN